MTCGANPKRPRCKRVPGAGKRRSVMAANGTPICRRNIGSYNSRIFHRDLAIFVLFFLKFSRLRADFTRKRTLRHERVNAPRWTDHSKRTRNQKRTPQRSEHYNLTSQSTGKKKVVKNKYSCNFILHITWGFTRYVPFLSLFSLNIQKIACTTIFI